MRAIRSLRSIARSGRALPLSDPASSPFRSSATSAGHNRPLIDRLPPVIKRARRETERVNHDYAGTEHLLLALASLALSPVNENERLLWRLFGGLRVHPLWVIQEVEFRFGFGCWETPATDDDPLVTLTISQAIQLAHDKARGRGSHSKRTTDAIPLTPRAKQAIELARHEAQRLGSHSVGFEHLLLGLLREGGPGADVLRDAFDVSLDRARLQVAQGGDSIDLPPVEARPARKYSGRGGFY